MGKIGILATAVVSGAIVLGGIVYVKNSPAQEKKAVTKDRATEEGDLRRAEKLMSQGKVEEATKIIHSYEDEISVRTELGRRWLDLLIASCMKSGNYAQLMILYEAYPQAFENNEKAAIMVGNSYILAKQPQQYQEVRSRWEDRLTDRDSWAVLDADALLLEGKKQEAIKLLKSMKFEGQKDVDRLVRLALLYVIDNPKASWDYLSDAYNIDPKNPDILTYRGKLLESLGKAPLALYEYLAAIQVDPSNLFLRDQLAEFYMRRNQTSQALSVWLETLSKPSLDLIWMKALFWSKVLSPVQFDWAKASPPAGSSRPFIEYLIALPAGTFWDQEAFDQLPNGKKYLSEFQITFWLRLLEALKNRNDNEAHKLIKFNTFTGALLNPQLEKAVKQILSYRETGSLNFDVAQLKDSGKEKGSDQSSAIGGKAAETFFDQLDAYASKELSGGGQKLPPELHDLLMSKEVFSAAFLAGGWLEASLALHKMSVLPNNFPDWIAYGLTQALRSNRSTQEALAFAVHQKRTPALSLLIGELYIAESKFDEALAALDPYLKEQSEIGYRAVWLTGVIYADKGEYEKAKEIVESQPKVAEEVGGKEILARIALAQGNIEAADKLYLQLQEESPEAMSYLARKAYAEKNWKRAQELTEQLILMFPDSPILRDNLNKIVEEQRAQGSP